MVTLDAVQAQYDKCATIYDLRWKSYITNTLTFLQRHMSLTGGETILDVGCGTGELERLLVAKHPTQKIIGVDLSANMLKIARQKLADYPQLRFCQGRVSELPFPKRIFDVVVTANAFHYFNHPHDALLEMQRVLKPNGKLYILDWCRDYFFCQLCDLVLPRFDPAYRTCYNQQECRYFNSEANFDILAEQKKRFSIIWGIMLAVSQAHRE